MDWFATYEDCVRTYPTAPYVVHCDEGWVACHNLSTAQDIKRKWAGRMIYATTARAA